MKKTIVLYINSIRHGGAERVITQLATHLSKQNYDVILATSFKSDDEYIVSGNVKRVWFESNHYSTSIIKRNFKRILALRSLCKRENADLLISFMAEPNFRSIFATFGLRTKTIISVRNDPNKEYAGIVGKVIGKCILPFASGCVFQTKDAQSWFPKRLIKKSEIILNEVDQVFFSTPRLDVSKNIVSIGRLEEQKNHKLLIDSFNRIADRFPNVQLHIYGEGSKREELSKQIYAYGLEHRVILKGITNDVPNVLSKAYLFVLSSDYEGMPNCLMEAMAVGVPCISTDCPCGGPATLITNNKDGMLVNCNDEKELTEAMSYYLLNYDVAESFGRKAKERALMFKPDKVFAEWDGFINSIIFK